MGLPVGFVGEEPEFAAAMERVTALSKKYSKALMGAALGPDMVKERLRQGFTILVSTIDLYVLAFGSVTELRTARETAEAYMLTQL
jgi:hypothetical protein